MLAGAAAAASLVVAGPAPAQAPADERFWRDVAIDNRRGVERALRDGVDPNAVDARGEPALLVALRHDAGAVAQLLAAHPRLEVDRRNALDETALMLAVHRRQPEVARVLLARGARVDQPGWTALHYAADAGAEDLVRLLVEAGARIEAQSPNGTTPLMMAARNAHGGVARWLVAQGARTDPRNAQGWSAADFARSAGAVALADELAAASPR